MMQVIGVRFHLRVDIRRAVTHILHVKQHMAPFLASILLLSGSVDARDAGRIVESDVRFTADHSTKFIHGRCLDVRVEDFAGDWTDGKAALAKPFSVVILVASMSTENRNRDSTMMEMFGYPKHKEIRARFREAVMDGTTVVLTGDLEIAGKTRPLVVKGTVTDDGKSIVLAGTFAVKLSDYGLEPPRLLFLSVKDTVQVAFRFRTEAP